MCERCGMDDLSTPSKLAKAAGISRSYACEILQGRSPSRVRAIEIFRRTGLKFGPIASLSDSEIDALEGLLRKAA
jgi:hypothetical protein